MQMTTAVETSLWLNQHRQIPHALGARSMSHTGAVAIVKRRFVSGAIATQIQNAFARESFSVDPATPAAGTKLIGIVSYAWRAFVFSSRQEAEDAAAGQYCSTGTVNPEASTGLFQIPWTGSLASRGVLSRGSGPKAIPN